MDKLFLKTYFYVLLGLSIIFAIIFSIFDLNELYTGITYHAEVIPAVVVTGAFAVLCFLSLLIAAICVRRWGNTPIRFSWGNLIFFLLFSALCVFILWETPAEMTLIEYVKLCYSDVILLGASALISVTLISAISYVFRQTKNQIGEDVEASKNWYLVFILLTLLSALIYLIIGVLMFERGYNQFGTTFYLLFINKTLKFTQ